MSARAMTRSGAIYGLSVLSVINLLNYLDRYILAGVMEHVQNAFHLNNTEGGLLTTTFMVVYMCAAPLGGFLSDRMPRQYLIAGAVLIWSLATIGSGLATTFALLLVARAVTGVGEAGYGTVAPAFISDLFKKEERSRMLAFFYTAMPLGAAAGFIVGGTIGEKYSWQTAFFVGGVPGLALAALAYFMPQPVRGGMDLDAPPAVPFLEGLTALSKNVRWLLTTAGLTLMTFSIGGLSVWMPKFLSTERGFTGTQAGLALGATTVIGGFAGTIVGGFLGDWMDRRRPGGGVWLSGVGMLLAAPLMVMAAMADSKPVLLGCLVGAQFLLFLNNGPLNAALVNVVPPAFRGFAFGISTLLLHLLGDAASPTVIGWVADQSNLGTAIKLNALPVVAAAVVLLVGAGFFRRYRALPRAETSSSAA